MGGHSGDADRDAETGQLHARRAKVTDGWIRRHPIRFGVVEQRVRRKAAAAVETAIRNRVIVPSKSPSNFYGDQRSQIVVTNPNRRYYRLLRLLLRFVVDSV